MSDKAKKAVGSVTSVVLPNHVIQIKLRHSTEIVAATGANLLVMVKNIVAKSEYYSGVRDKVLTPENGFRNELRSHQWLWRALKEVLTHPRDGSPTKYLSMVYNGKLPEPASVDIQEAWVSELLTWLVFNASEKCAGDIAPQKLIMSASETRYADEKLLELSKKVFLALSFLEPARQRVGTSIEFASTEDMDWGDEYKVLVTDRWYEESLKDERRQYSILSRYIQFLNNTNNGGFELFEVDKDASDIEFDV
ncbi:uncharacterized protein NMK_1810 [Novimethylophilus kurashikiensis]|uniref:Uncharacterized protein n=1 Tax=Novimethylophilus kurashikiensis TaxID=1825523 RepID=A0A2R5F883_9PROT|nr:hypothetical protein [Novimethylophilus kurashikiensis]GBG14245.1 uncharacterized protein NMK_1810 [Novimethylophilus kurashikiensis]